MRRHPGASKRRPQTQERGTKPADVCPALHFNQRLPPLHACTESLPLNSFLSPPGSIN